MKIEEMMEFFTSKYIGELDKDFDKDVDPELAKNYLKITNYFDELQYSINDIKESLKWYFDLQQMSQKAKSEERILQADRSAHDLVHTALSLWTQIEGMLPED